MRERNKIIVYKERKREREREERKRDVFSPVSVKSSFQSPCAAHHTVPVRHTTSGSSYLRLLAASLCSIIPKWIRERERKKEGEREKDIV